MSKRSIVLSFFVTVVTYCGNAQNDTISNLPFNQKGIVYHVAGGVKLWPNIDYRSLFYADAEVFYKADWNKEVGLGASFLSNRYNGEFGDPNRLSFVSVPIYLKGVFSVAEKRTAFFLDGSVGYPIGTKEFTGKYYLGAGCGVRIITGQRTAFKLHLQYRYAVYDGIKPSYISSSYQIVQDKIINPNLQVGLGVQFR